MFKLNEINEVDRRNLNFDYISYSPGEVSTINTPNSQTNFNIPKMGSVVSLLNSFFEINFEVFKKNDNSRYENGNDKRLVNLGPIALITNF